MGDTDVRSEHQGEQEGVCRSEVKVSEVSGRHERVTQVRGQRGDDMACVLPGVLGASVGPMSPRETQRRLTCAGWMEL